MKQIIETHETVEMMVRIDLGHVLPRAIGKLDGSAIDLSKILLANPDAGMLQEIMPGVVQLRTRRAFVRILLF